MKILIPVDFGKSSLNACDYAIEMAKVLNCRITLLHVIENPVILGKAYREALRFEVNNKMDKMIAAVRNSHPGFNPDVDFKQGDVDDVIIKYAKEKKIDMILTGTSGYGPVARFLLGNPS